MLLIAAFLILLVVFVVARVGGPRVRIPIVVLYGIIVIISFALPFVSREALAGVWALILTLPSSLFLLILISAIGVSNSIIIGIGVVAAALLNGYLLWRIAKVGSRCSASQNSIYT